jgi:CheY-like chemotaxis protein
MNDRYEKKKESKAKKDVKWYTYVDSHLESKLRDFMEEYEINNKAKIIRNFVNYSMDYLSAIYQKKSHDAPQKFDEIQLDDLIRKAIDEYEIGNSFQEELRQKISPLKLSLLMLNNNIQEKEKLFETLQTALNALEELEITVKHHFEEPNIRRYVKKIDILYVEDNELERRTIDHFFKAQGVNIKSIETSDEAMYILKNLTPRVILIDVNLKTSNLNGDSLCHMLKSTTQYSPIPIILISAVFSEVKKKEILATTGADDIIFKPIDKLQDLDILYKYLKQY